MKDVPGTRKSVVAPVIGGMVVLILIALLFIWAMDEIESLDGPLAGRNFTHKLSGVEGTILFGIYPKRVRVQMYEKARGFYIETFLISELEIEEPSE